MRSKARKYAWLGVNSQAQVVQGDLLAPDAAYVRRYLALSGIAMTRCQATPSGRTPARLSSRHLSLLTQQWARLMQAGIPLLQALMYSAQGLRHAPSQALVERIRQRIEAGQSLYQALSAEPGLSVLYLQLVRAGEQSGQLERVLQQLAQHLQDQQTLRASLKSALWYPCTLGGVALAVLVVVLTQVVPVFEAVFSQMGAALPVPTQWLLQVSRAMLEYSLLGMVVIVGALTLAWQVWHRVGVIKAWFLNAGLRSPVLGSVWQLACQQRFAATLALLLQAGITLTDALPAAGLASGHRVYERAAQGINQQVQIGHDLAHAMRQAHWPGAGVRAGLFSSLLIHLVALGESSGQLDAMLQHWAVYAHERLQAQVKQWTQWLEPALIVVMGAVIGGLVVALYLPMFQLGQAFG